MNKSDAASSHAGKQLIAGEWVAINSTLNSALASEGKIPAQVDAAVKGAEQAFWSYGYSTRTERAAFLDSIAEEIEARGKEITAIGTSETGLTETRLEGERNRTIQQLRLFARHIENGDYLDSRHDEALPNRKPLPRPDLRMIQRPIGPVAVFGASNFPLAFSTAGGDTAAALAAGCPVVVKGHNAHPGTSVIVAQAIEAATKKCGVHPGVFSLLQSGERLIGQSLVQHPLIKAVGFTGSLAGGRALFDLCAARDEPIPFYGELGSINPMFLLPEAIRMRGAEIAEGWSASLTMGAGQFCTKPGIAVIIEGPEVDAFVDTIVAALERIGAQTMLTVDIAEAYRAGCDRIAGTRGIQGLLTSTCNLRNATPYLFSTTGSEWLANETLGEEVFGPLGIVVRVADMEEMIAVAKSLEGQLTCTLHMHEGDTDAGRKLMPILERKAGRLLANGYPTGVEVCDAMVHGGPYPASTNFGATSVGTLSIRRFLRPVCYQNIPESLLPADLPS